MKLSDRKIRNIKPSKRRRTFADRKRLSLAVEPNGTKSWHYRFQWQKKPQLISLGIYPAVSLAKARAKAEQCDEALAAGLHPKTERDGKLTNTFGAIASDYVWSLELAGRAPATIKKHATLLSVLLPELGGRPIGDISSRELLLPLIACFNRGHPTMASEARALASRIFSHAIGLGVAENDPASPLAKNILFKNIERGKLPGITDPDRLRELIQCLHAAADQKPLARALLLLAHTFVRPSELREANWAEIDWEKRLWIVPPDRTKLRRQHIIPLTDTTFALFRTQLELSGTSKWVFPSPLEAFDKPISATALNKTLRALGWSNDEHVPHGFRTTASTLLNEFSREWELSADHIEKQLAHQSADKIRATYNEAEWLSKRTEMMKRWSAYLDDLAITSA